ncbi:hypothetical protein IGI04_036548 [Brassica rapa subsp. trilocularis]|uniref:Uncharacterized protein n=1 Tax=Brassica rapa subsp. trilocularis TaxID=1813537 RepID=A0ABQ7LHS2_BRACM|nr:hypothetical protein IGI04_036548 [Brassica rapa subsp. trilocularis]
MAATKMFLIKWYSSSTNLKSSGSRLEVIWTSWKSSDKVVWTSRKSSGLPGSRLDFSERFGFSDLEDFWDDLPVSRLEVIWKSSGLPKSLLTKSSGLPESRLDFQKVVWTSRKSSGLTGSRLDFSERFGFSDLEDFWDDLPVSHLEVVWKSSGLPKSRLDFLCIKCANNVFTHLQINEIIDFSSLFLIFGSLICNNKLQWHTESQTKVTHPESSLWRESERYVVFSSQEWKKKKGKSILEALRASNWLFMVVVVLMTMAFL